MIFESAQFDTTGAFNFVSLFLWLPIVRNSSESILFLAAVLGFWIHTTCQCKRLKHRHDCEDWAVLGLRNGPYSRSNCDDMTIIPVSASISPYYLSWLILFLAKCSYQNAVRNSNLWFVRTTIAFLISLIILEECPRPKRKLVFPGFQFVNFRVVAIALLLVWYVKWQTVTLYVVRQCNERCLRCSRWRNIWLCKGRCGWSRRPRLSCLPLRGRESREERHAMARIEKITGKNVKLWNTQFYEQFGKRC
jgi:hypothetical protein